MILPSSFVFGLIFGSFLNVVIYRLNPALQLKSGVFGRSICPNCRTVLKWFDLIPVFSFIFLHGRCRYCHEKISWQYPIVEVLSGLIWVLAAYKLNFSAFGEISSIWGGQFFSFIYYIFILSVFIIVVVYDFKWHIIPDKIIYPAIFISILYNGFLSFKSASWQTHFLEPLLTALIVFTFFFLLFYFSSGRAMGLGDAKLGFLIALFLNPLSAAIALMLAFIIGAICGIILIGFGKKTFKSQIAFGPFLVLGAIATFFLSDLILNFMGF